MNFTDPIKVGDMVLPKGDYSVQHTMEGENHIMVFTQLRVKDPVIARVQCHIVPLENKAPSSQVIYTHTGSEQHVLQELIFAGEKAKHVF